MKLTVPTSLSEINLNQLQKLTALESEDLEPIELQKRSIELLTGTDRDIIDKFRLKDLEAVYSTLLKLSNSEGAFHKFVNIEGVKYGFHTNLSEITTGEFADLDTFCKDLNENLHLIMSILYRPVTYEKHGKYKVEEYGKNVEQRAELFKNKMPANVVNGALVFFWNIGKDYLKNLTASLVGERQTKSKSDSLKNGVGIK